MTEYWLPAGSADDTGGWFRPLRAHCPVRGLSEVSVQRSIEYQTPADTVIDDVTIDPVPQRSVSFWVLAWYPKRRELPAPDVQMNLETSPVGSESSRRPTLTTLW
jgi:hypothetical protein